MTTLLATSVFTLGVVLLPILLFYISFRAIHSVRQLVGRGRPPFGPAASLHDHAVGRRPRLLAALAYALGPLTGSLVLLLERRDHYVRFHAMQSVMAGLLHGVFAYLLFFVLLLLVLTPPVGWILAVGVAGAFAICSVTCWALMLRNAAAGNPWRDPLVGDAAWRRVERNRRAHTIA